jgi:hypothetical protein
MMKQHHQQIFLFYLFWMNGTVVKENELELDDEMGEYESNETLSRGKKNEKGDDDDDTDEIQYKITITS